MQKRSEDWVLGPINPFTEAEREWYARHEPTVDAWLRELEDAGDPWWQSAEHAAYCFVSDLEMNAAEPTWEGFHVGDFLFRNLWEGGTVAWFGSVPIFFDHLREALRRFAADGLVPAEDARKWLAQMDDAREDFIRCYDEGTDPRTASEIAREYRRDLPPVMVEAERKSIEPRRPKRRRPRVRHPRRRHRRRPAR